MKTINMNGKEIRVFDVGDKVRVVDYKTTLGSNWIYYESVGGWYKPGCGEYFLKEMEEFCGMEATVLYVDEYDGIWLNVDKQKNPWNYQMLELVEPEDEPESDKAEEETAEVEDESTEEKSSDIEVELEPEKLIAELKRIGNEYTKSFSYEDYFGPLTTITFSCNTWELTNYIVKCSDGITDSEISKARKEVKLFLYHMKKCYEFTEKEPKDYRKVIKAYWKFINQLPVISEAERQLREEEKREEKRQREIAEYGEELPF